MGAALDHALYRLEDDDFEWHDRGACRGLDLSKGDPFFPAKGGSTRKAKAICGGCEVRDVCLEWALANGIEYGIYGGLSGRERKAFETERQGGMNGKRR